MYTPPWISAGQTKLEDVGAELVNSFAKGVQQNLQAKQYKNELARLDLAIKEHEDLQDYRREELKLRQQGLDQANDMKQWGLELREETMNRKFDDLNQGRTEFTNIMRGLGEIDPNSETAEQEFHRLVGDNPYGAMTTGGRQAQRNWWQGRNQNARTKGAALRSEYNTWAKDIQNSLGGGYPMDMSLLLDPKVWKEQYPEYGEGGQGKGKPTGQVFVKVGVDKTTNEPIYLTRPKSFVEQKAREYQDFQRRFKSNVIRQRSMPSLDVFPESEPDDPGGTSSNPTSSDIEYLRMHPEQASKFEARFGKGSSQQYL